MSSFVRGVTKRLSSSTSTPKSFSSRSGSDTLLAPENWTIEA